MDNSELYEKICSDRFKKLEEGQGDIKKEIMIIREKIFNGLEHHASLNTKLILVILSGVIISIVVPLVRSFF